MNKEKEYKINFSVLYKQEGINPDEEFVNALEEKLIHLENSQKNKRSSMKIPLLTASALIIATIIFISFIQSSTVNNLINRPATENPQLPIKVDKKEKDNIITPIEIEEDEFSFDELFNRFPNLEEIYNSLIDSYDVVLANYTIGYLKALFNQDRDQVKNYTHYANIEHLVEKYKYVDFNTIELLHSYPSWKDPNLTFTYGKNEEYVFLNGLPPGLKYSTDIIPVYQDESKILISERYVRAQPSWKVIEFEAKGNNDITITSSFSHSSSQSLDELNTLIKTTIETMKKNLEADTRVEVLYNVYPYISMVLVEEGSSSILEGTLINVEKVSVMKLYDRFDNYTNFGSLDFSIIDNLDGMLEYVNEVYNLGWAEEDFEQASYYFDEERQVRLIIVEENGEIKYLPLTHTFLNTNLLDKASYQ